MKVSKFRRCAKKKINLTIICDLNIYLYFENLVIIKFNFNFQNNLKGMK